MQKLTGVFRKIEKRNALVIGDLFSDSYTFGKAKRISPEAPVAVVHVTSEESRPGGAGNVALNLISLGMGVIVSGRIGSDLPGEAIRSSFLAEGIGVEGLLEEKNYQTPVKNRIIADHQQIVRVDHEKTTALSEAYEQQLIEKLPALLERVSVVAISDYGKGFLTDTLLQAVIEQANLREIPVIVDPKGVEFQKYRGATLIKPNLSEAYAAAALPLDASLERVSQVLLECTEAKHLMITRSEEGISLFSQNAERMDFPTKVHEVKDVTGAGDTVLAILACSLANRLTLPEAAELANITAGIAVQHLGCARVSMNELARELLMNHTENKIFDGEHLFALQEALHDRSYSLLAISESEGMTPLLFRHIREAASEVGDLLVYVRDGEESSDFVNAIASLREVDFMVIKSQSLQHLCSLIHPNRIWSIEQGQIQQLQSSALLLQN